METQRKKRVAVLGIRTSLLFLASFGILVLVAYFVLSQNIQGLLTDYTLQMVQSMTEQGVTAVEYELRVGREEAAALADAFAEPNAGERSAAFPPANTDILRMVYLSDAGTVVSDGKRRDIADRQDIIEAFQGKTAVYGPYFNEDHEYVICYSAPVRRNGSITGVLSTEKDGYYFCSLIQNIRFINTGEAYIINAEGTDIAVSEQAHIEWVNDQYNARKLLEEREDPVTRAIMELEQKGLDGETGTGVYYWEGDLCYLVYAPIPSTGWVLLAGLRQEELAAMTQATLNASLTTGPALAVCIAVFLLLSAIIVFWVIVNLQKSSEMNEKLNILANYDPLTGAMNRNSYHSALQAYSAGDRRSLACIYIDVNGLHEVNNHLGHQAGDKMLKSVADVLRREFSPESIYRIGGDEFVVFCPDWDRPDVHDRLALARRELRDQGYEISVGVAWREQNAPVQTMVGAAEEAMRQDKRRYYQENGNERQMRALDQKFKKMVTEKQDADTFLSILAPEFKGVYFVDLGNDTIRHLYIPSYFEEMLEESGDRFSKALLLYAERIVTPEFRAPFLQFCNYACVKSRLEDNAAPEFIYQKNGGDWLKLQVLKFKTYTAQCQETLWIFKDIDC